MGRREDFSKTVSRQKPEEVPFNFEFCQSLQDEFYRRIGEGDYHEYFDMPFRTVNPKASKNVPDYTAYFNDLKNIDYIDEWGVGHIKGGLAHFSRMVPPMQQFQDPEQIFKFPLPDILADYRWEGVAEKIQELRNKDLVTLSGGYAIDIFEPAWYLRGMETLLMDFLINPAMAEACLDRMSDIKCKLAARWAEMGVDVIIYGDDVGTERAMMMSPDIWRKWLKPYLNMAIQTAKRINPKVLCYYHSDGNIEDIIPDLIEVGVDILNPIQPESMDPKKIKELYGDKLCLWGTIGTQTTMPFDTPSGVRNTVRDMIESAGYNGGLVVAPTHLLEPEVPWDNIIAFIEAVKGGIS